MTELRKTSFYTEVSKGNIPNHSLVHKFGRNDSVGTSYVPLTMGGVYQTLQPAVSAQLRIKAGGNANDTSAGTGARKVMLEGLDATGAFITEELTTAGASASSATSLSFIRLFRAYVSESGTYATATAGSHSGDIVIEGGGVDWATIDSTGFARSQTEIGAYTVPLGYTAYLTAYLVTTDSSKAVDILFFKRESILDASAPYDAMRLQFEAVGVEGEFARVVAPQEFSELTDIGFMAKVASGTADVSVNFDLLLVANS